MKKVNIEIICAQFIEETNKLLTYVENCRDYFKDKKAYLTYTYEYAIIALYKEFEYFLLKTIICGINHDHSIVEKTYNVCFGRHVNDDICEFIITKGDYFDFKGRDGLLKALKQNIGEEHEVRKIFKKEKYRESLDLLYVFRNYAAHDSEQSKSRVKDLLKMDRISGAGAWLKKQNRLESIAKVLIELVEEIRSASFK